MTAAAVPYVFQEYPKHVTVEGKLFVCRDADEEEEARKTGAVYDEAADRKRLMKIAEVKELKMDARWKIDRMRDLISNAGYDPDLNPFE